MYIVFISDLHLSDHSPEMTALFCRFLSDCTQQAAGLYILGDFFDAWIGDDDLGQTGQTVIAALQQSVRSGLPVFLMHGNRDFLIGKRFLKASGCQLLPDEYLLSVGNERILLMHGDTLCTNDTAYLKFRRFSRNPLIKKLFLMRSIQSRRATAARYRKASMDYTATAPNAIMDVTPDAVLKIMQKHRVRSLIHGHTHRPAIHTFEIDHQPAERCVLPAWHGCGGALLLTPSGKQLISLDPHHYQSPF